MMKPGEELQDSQGQRRFGLGAKIHPGMIYREGR
jgi:hypothetical protein